MKQKILSIVLALSLCLSLLPNVALAAEEHTCVDEDVDYWCDTCGEIMEHTCADADEDGDYWCDVVGCWKVIEHTCVDVTDSAEDSVDHYCALCGEHMSELCRDGDDDHDCDVCWVIQEWRCSDTNNDHYCDNENCRNRLSYCEDNEGDDNICDICGGGIYPNARDLNVEAEIGDGSITVSWTALEDVGADCVASYTVYCYEEDADKEDAETKTYAADEGIFAHIFNGLTNGATYRVGVCASYTDQPSGGESQFTADMEILATLSYIDLWVGGVQFTDELLTIEDGKGGTATYDPDTNTLTLNDYTYEGEGYSWEDGDKKYAAAIYYGGSDALTIELRGTSSVTQESDAALDLTCGIHSEGDLEIVSTDSGNPGKLTATGGKTTAAEGISCGVYAYGSITVSSGSLTGTGNESHYVSYGVFADKITVSNGSLMGVGGDVSETTYYYSCGVFTYFGITMEGGELTGTGGTSSAYSYGVVPCGDITMEDGSLTGEGGAAAADSYGVCARLYDYNAEDSYANITVTGGSLMGVGGTATKNSGGVYVDDNITVTGGSLTGEGGTAGADSIGVETNENITVTGGSLTGVGGMAGNDSWGVYAYNDITVTGGSLTGIGGTAEKDSYGVGAYNGITVTGGRLTGEGGTAAINKVPEIDGEARVWYGESEETAVFTFAESLEDYYDDQQYVRIVLWDFYVGGTKVTSENLSGNGWSYDPTTNTLTLNDYTYEGEGYSWEDVNGKCAAAIYYNGSDRLTLDLYGTSIVTYESDTDLDVPCGIFIVGDLEIVSTDPGNPGKLTATGDQTDDGISCGVVAGRITVYGGSLTGIGKESHYVSYGVTSDEINIIDGSLKGVGGDVSETTQYYSYSCGVVAYDGSITMEGGELTGTGGTSSATSYGVVAYDGSITISGDGSLTGEGGTAGNYSYGVVAYYKDSITISGDGSLTGEGGAATNNSYGVYAYDITVSGGSLTGEGGTAGNNSYGVYAYYDSITISGDGSLTGKGGTADNYSWGVYAYNNIAVTDGRLTGVGGTAGYDSVGVEAKENITVTDGSLTGEGGTANNSWGVYVYDDITVSGGSLTGTSGTATNRSYGVDAYDITVSGGSLTATGGEATGESGKSYGVDVYDISVSGGSLTAAGGEVNRESGYSCGVNAYNDITVTGGSLTTTGGAANESYGVYTDGNITVSGGSLTGEGGAASSSYGVYACDSITVGSGSLEGTGGVAFFSGGVYADAITVSGGSLTATGGEAEFFSYGVTGYDIRVSGGETIAQGGAAAFNTVPAVSTGLAAYDVNGREIENPNYTDLTYVKIAAATTSPVWGGGGSFTMTETTKNEDGSTTTTTTDKFTGTVTETTNTTDGVAGTVVTDKNGNVVKVSAKVPAVAVEEAEKSGKAVTLPIEVEVADNTDEAQEIAMDVPAGGATVEIPVENVTSGTVVVIVNTDGSETIVKKSTVSKDGVVVTLEQDAVIKVIDNSKDFVDVHSVDHWAKDAIDFVVSRGIYAGTGNTTFHPNNPMTRGMLAVVLHNLEDNPDHAFDGAFHDVAEGSWYEDAIRWAADEGIVGGYGNGLYGPEDNISREQLAVMLWRYAGSPKVDHDLSHFVDADQISGYAREALEWVNANGIINGKGNGILDPKGNATRAEVAQMLKNYLVNVL